MELEPLTEEKKNGVFYTPKSLADRLFAPMIADFESLDVFDPSYGNGALLSTVFSCLNNKCDNLNLFGCDINPDNSRLDYIPFENLTRCDFLEYESNQQFDIIVTNPPYVRHQYLDKKRFKELRKKYTQFQSIGNASDLWGYFLIKSIYHLKENGAICAVLPWSFIQADFAINIRRELIRCFRSVKLLALNNQYFDGVQERIVLLWCTGKGQENMEIGVDFPEGDDAELNFKLISSDEWLMPRLMRNSSELDDYLDELKNNYSFQKFDNYGNVRIGVVTGADKFFIRDKAGLNCSFRSEEQTPILTKVEDIIDYLNVGSGGLKMLVRFNSDRHNGYLSEGIKNEYHLRSHSKMRSPWYSVVEGKIPDAFIPYRVGRIPFMILNKEKLQSTNSIHRVYFNGLTVTEQKWIAVSIVSAFGQLSFKKYSKSYGRGMMKIEPGMIKNIMVFCSNDRSIEKIYNQTIRCLAEGKKDDAMITATEFLKDYLGIGDDFTQRVMAQSISGI